MQTENELSEFGRREKGQHEQCRECCGGLASWRRDVAVGLILVGASVARMHTPWAGVPFLWAHRTEYSESHLRPELLGLGKGQLH